MNELLTSSEVAPVLKITPRTVGLWRRQGLLRAVRFSAREFRYRRSDVEKLIREKLEPVAKKRD